MRSYFALLIIGALCSTTRIVAAQVEWFTAGPEVRYGILAIAADFHHPGVLYAGANEKNLYKSVDGGNSWQAIWESPLATVVAYKVSDIATDPHHPNTVYIGISPNTGIYKSVDSGITWTLVNAGLHSKQVSLIVVDPQRQDVLYTVAGDRLYRSVDGAGSWQLVLQDVGYVAVHAGGSHIVYATSANGVFEKTLWKSLDGGMSWTQVATGLPYMIQIDPHNPDVLYLAGSALRENDSAGVIFKSLDGGLTWQQIFELPGGGISALAIDPMDTNRIYAGSGGKVHRSGVFRSTDGGHTWAEIHTAGPRDLLIDPSDHTLIYAAMNSGAWGVFRARLEDDRTVVQPATWGQVKVFISP